MSLRSEPTPFVSVLLRTTAWYLVLGFVWWLARAFLPPDWGALFGGSLTGTGVGSGTVPFTGAEPTPMPGPATLPTVIAMLTAAATALPVSWIYTYTRTKRGYRQSVVQTLLILPVVVAGIVVLVKHSLALAFSLAGIVAAVRFRTTLDDSKDAANIFVVTGLGLAAAVDPPVALVISLCYNLLIVTLWFTDFGRAPALEGRDASQRLERAMELSNRTGTFIARLDDEVLQELAPEQLDALAQRAWRRRKRSGAEVSDDNYPRFTHLLRVRTMDADATRAASEKEFDELFSSWKYMGKSKAGDGERVLEYGVTFAPTVTPGVVSDTLRALPSGAVLGVEFRT